MAEINSVHEGNIYNENMSREKQSVALSSVIAAVFLTVVKIVIGILSGSLSILSEAAHSALDLGAAVVTLFAVKVADKPADKEHHYGHGKMENLSAFIETVLLLLTCAWIMYEAVKRLFFGSPGEIEVNLWAYGIMILSIIINISRAAALRKVAKKYNSYALEADALHFMSDVWSSLVVIGGLIFVNLGFKLADPIAALGVCVLVIIISIKLGKRTIEVLLDTAPRGMMDRVTDLVKKTVGVVNIGNVRIRLSGANCFIDVNVGISRNESHRGVHNIAHSVKERIVKNVPNSDVTVSTYPVDTGGVNDRELLSGIKRVVDGFALCTNIHNINVYEVEGRKHIALHIEVRDVLTLEQSHELSHKIEEEIIKNVPEVSEASVHIEESRHTNIEAEDVTRESAEMIQHILELADCLPDSLGCHGIHDIKVYRQGGRYATFLHCTVKGNARINDVDLFSKELIKKIKENLPQVENVFVHMEPVD